jgi:hypothetical protein
MRVQLWVWEIRRRGGEEGGKGEDDREEDREEDGWMDVCKYGEERRAGEGGFISNGISTA